MGLSARWRKIVGKRCPRSFIICAFFAALSVQSLHAQRDEQAVRAAFVYNLTKYVTWPNSRTELVIGFVGEGSKASILQHVIDGKTSEGRSIRVALNPSDLDMQRCDILYFAGTSSNRIRTILDKIRNKGILTVGEDVNFMREGGMVGLVREEDQIQIEIDLDAARAGGLRISSRLLDLALIVHCPRGGSR